MVPQLAEVLLAEPEQCRAVELGVPTDPVVGVRMELLASAVPPGLARGVPALLSTSAGGALLIGVSMVPRAEIAMIIGQQARQLGDWAMPPEVYSGIALVSLVTCILTPFVVRYLLSLRDGTGAGQTG